MYNIGIGILFFIISHITSILLDKIHAFMLVVDDRGVSPHFMFIRNIVMSSNTHTHDVIFSTEINIYKFYYVVRSTKNTNIPFFEH